MSAHTVQRSTAPLLFSVVTGATDTQAKMHTATVVNIVCRDRLGHDVGQGKFAQLVVDGVIARRRGTRSILRLQLFDTRHA